MPTLEAEAVVLRQYDLSEADRIIVFFTREFGKLRAVAQGAKRPKSRLGACLEPLNHVHLRFYLREGADLARIRECETIHAYLGRGSSLLRLYAFTYMAELLHETVQENNPNSHLFRLFLAIANASDSLGIREGLLRYFELWTLKLNGLLPNYDYCSACGRCVKDEGFYTEQKTGQGLCDACSGKRGIRVRPAAAESLSNLVRLSPREFATKALGREAATDLERFSQMLLELHLEKRLKSYGALKESLRES